MLEKKASRRLFGYKVHDSEILIQALLEVGRGFTSAPRRSRCETVLCAVREMFGPLRGPKLLYIYLKYGFLASHYTVRNARPWTDTELELILESLGNLPEFMFPLPKPSALVAEKKQTNKKNASGKKYFVFGEVLNGSHNLIMYDDWRSLSSRSAKILSLLHEVAHVIGKQLSLERSEDWKKVAKHDVIESSKKVDRRSKSSFVTRYSMASLEEDFAESFVAYRFAPDTLQSRSAEKYRFFNEVVFSGVDYLERDACSKRSMLGHVLSSRVSSDLSQYRNCGRHIMNTVLDENNRPELLACLKTEVLRQQKLNWDAIQPEPKHLSLIQKTYENFGYPHIENSKATQSSVLEALAKTLIYQFKPTF